MIGFFSNIVSWSRINSFMDRPSRFPRSLHKDVSTNLYLFYYRFTIDSRSVFMLPRDVAMLHCRLICYVVMSAIASWRDVFTPNRFDIRSGLWYSKKCHIVCLQRWFKTYYITFKTKWDGLFIQFYLQFGVASGLE